MENHIFSMLKGAGVIEGNDNEFYEDLEESNVDYLKEELAKKANKSDIPSTTP